MNKPYETENDLVELDGVTRVSYAKFDVEYIYLKYRDGREDELAFEHGGGKGHFDKMRKALK